MDADLDWALADFLGRHSMLHTLCLRGPGQKDEPRRRLSRIMPGSLFGRASGAIHATSPVCLPNDALPDVEHLIANIRFGWILNPSPGSLTNLTAVTLGLQSDTSAETPKLYIQAMDAIAARPGLQKLTLKIGSWAPWTWTVDSPQPERKLGHLASLHLMLRWASPRIFSESDSGVRGIVAWLKRFPLTPVKVRCA